MKSLDSVAILVTVMLASVTVSGCGKGSDSTGTVPDSAASQSSNMQATAQDITLTQVDRAAYDEVIAGHRGKVVLVDFWATWCPPCVQQFPHTVELQRNSDPRELAVVSVSMDEPDDKETVLAFLEHNNATLENLISEYGVGQAGVEAFEITDGAIPHYKIYDRTGQLRHTTNSNAEIDQVVEQLLDES